MLDNIVATREQVLVKETIHSQVITACQGGDREALRSLFEAYKDRVYSIALYSLGGDEAGAADITQQVFLKLLTRIGQFRGDSEFTTWLYRLVVNTCRDEQRKQRRLVALPELTLVKTETKETPARSYARREVAEQVQAAVASLKPKLRWPIVLKYSQELSYEEIATVLGCSKGTVASRLNRAHRALAKKLGQFREQL
jgi:RNA polymerase sigma-70 factor (ECF subfamily)